MAGQSGCFQAIQKLESTFEDASIVGFDLGASHLEQFIHATIV
jgi:hypothetical protein